LEHSIVRLLLFAAIAALIASLHGIGGAAAQSYPSRPVRFIIPFGPASGADMAARLVADRLAVRWGKPVLVENRPGGDGLVAIGAFTGAADDHTLLFGPAGTFAVHPYEHEKLPYDADRDLLPVASVTTIILAVSASGALKAGSLDEVVALIRAQPGKLNAAAANGNAHFLLFGFLQGSGLQVAKVPYRDIMQAPNDLAEDRIQLLATSLTVVLQAGKVKVLAVTSRQRAPSAPDVPTAREAGYPALELESPIGVFGPRGMPRELRERVAEDVRAVTAGDPMIATRLAATGQVVTVRGPAEFAAMIEELRAKLAATAKTLGIRPAR
jgi:tripartite-type tricarboxylate transporter receptor subunit TctC